MDIAGIDLITASAQPVTVLRHKSPSGERPIFVFLKPDGMEPVFHFETEAVTDQGGSIYRCDPQKQAEVFHVSKNGSSEDRQAALSAEILCLDRALTNQMYLLSDGTLLFTEGAVMEDSDGLRLETTSADNRILTYPKGAADLPFASAFPQSGRKSF